MSVCLSLFFSVSYFIRVCDSLALWPLQCLRPSVPLAIVARLASSFALEPNRAKQNETTRRKMSICLSLSLSLSLSFSLSYFICVCDYLALWPLPCLRPSVPLAIVARLASSFALEPNRTKQNGSTRRKNEPCFFCCFLGAIGHEAVRWTAGPLRTQNCWKLAWLQGTLFERRKRADVPQLPFQRPFRGVALKGVDERVSLQQ
jgi:hypothetical protein